LLAGAWVTPWASSAPSSAVCLYGVCRLLVRTESCDLSQAGPIPVRHPVVLAARLDVQVFPKDKAVGSSPTEDAILCLGSWARWSGRLPVTQEIAGSTPVGPAVCLM
jgi:hypothetical protein